MNLPESAVALGFGNGPGGTHTSRTIMLSELQLLLAARPARATYSEYVTAIVEENVLLKATTTTRRRSLRALRELYGLEPDMILFRALRDLWDADTSARPLLALLCSIARDPLLRATSSVIIEKVDGSTVTSQMLEQAVDASLQGRYNPSILAKIGRNAASSWRQSGHLSGRNKKVRTQADCRPVAVAYALLLGFLCDAGGDGLFRTLWARLLDAPENVLRAQASAASQQGWIEYRFSGDVTDVGFRYLLRTGQEELK